MKAQGQDRSIHNVCSNACRRRMGAPAWPRSSFRILMKTTAVALPNSSMKRTSANSGSHRVCICEHTKDLCDDAKVFKKEAERRGKKTIAVNGDMAV